MKPCSGIDQVDATFVVLAEPRRCSTCGVPTLTATSRQMTTRPGQTGHGRCLFCLRIPFAKELTDELEMRAEDLLMDAFPDSTAEYDYEPPRYAPGTYGGTEQVTITGRWLISGGPCVNRTFITSVRDAGPCSLCKRTIRRYGPYGRPLCTECEEVS